MSTAHASRPAVRVAVAAPNDLACAAAVQVAADGGNAVDAALAAVLVTTVSEPGLVSMAGAAYVTVSPNDGSPPVTIDGGVEMPGRGLPAERFGSGMRDVRTAYAGGVTMTVGHGSVATPGCLRALDLAHSTQGSIPWREVVAPAIAVARDGFPHGQASHTYLEFVHEDIFGWHPDSRAALHTADGRLIGPGERVQVPHLADSLQLLAEQGADAFYTGAIAEHVVAEVERGGGILTATDLAAYEAVVRPALQTRLGPWQLATNPAPAVGGVVVAAVLTLLAGRLSGAGAGSSGGQAWTDQDLRRIVGAQHAVLRHRADVIDVAADRQVAAEAVMDTVHRDVLALLTSPSTAHVSVVGDDGSACAITVSAGYNSGVLVPGTGIWLNNCLGEQELTPHGSHGERPGARLLSAMAPTVGRRSDGAVLAIGSPGSDRIPTSIAQVLALHVEAGLALDRAVQHPRVHVRLGSEVGDRADHEEDLELPADLGLPTHAMPVHSMYFGGVGVAMATPDGVLQAAGDPRRSGVIAAS